MDTEGKTPGIFSVSRGKGGWQFSRRDFILTAGAAAAGAALACGKGGEEPTATPESTWTPYPTMTAWPTETPYPTEAPPATMTADEIASYDRQTACLTATAHTDTVVALAIPPEGDRLISVDLDGVMKIWSLPEGQLVSTLSTSAEVIGLVGNGFSLSADGLTYVLTGWDNIARFLSFNSDEPLYTVDLSTAGFDLVMQTAFTPDGKMFVAESEGGVIGIWSLPEGVLLTTMVGGSTYGRNFAISPDSQLLATESIENGEISLFEIPSGNLLQTLTLYPDIAHSLVFSIDGSWLFAGCDYLIRRYSIPDGSALEDFSEGTYTVENMAVSADGKILAQTSLSDIRLLSLPDGELMANLIGDIAKTPGKMVFSPDGKKLYVASGYGSIDVWSVEDKSFQTCLIDISTVGSSTEVVQYEMTTTTGEVVTYVVPLGSTLPAGSVCVCNVVYGTYCSCVGNTSSGGGSHYWFPN